jgi:ElaA protein
MIILKHFSELTPAELYDALQLREEVFQLEQNCLYRDIDDKDRFCWHLLLYADGLLMAYARLVPEGVSYDGYCSIGRVVSRTVSRREGWGRQVMAEAMARVPVLFPGLPVRISAQAYLQRFYESFGFRVVSEPYLEDDIPHLAMVRE